MQYANDLFSREPGASELTKQQFIVLAAVEQNEGVSQTELVEMTGIDRSTLAEMIRRMTDRGLLQRERTESDARANAVHISLLGKRALRSARAANERVERSLLAGLPAAERAKFVRMAALIVSHAETERGPDGTPGRHRGRPRAR